MFQNIVHQFLDHAEDDQFLVGVQAIAVIMKTATGVHAARTADLLEEVVDGRFQSEIFQRRRHEAMRDIADQLDGIIDDLFGIVDTLQLRGLVEVHQVFVEVQAGGGQQGACIVVEIGSDALAFFFLEADRGIQQHFLLFLFQPLQLHLVAYHFPLVKDDKHDKADSQCQHTHGAKEQNQGHGTISSATYLQEEHGGYDRWLGL